MCFLLIFTPLGCSAFTVQNDVGAGQYYSSPEVESFSVLTLNLSLSSVQAGFCDVVTTFEVSHSPS